MGAVVLKNLVKRYAERGTAGVRAVNQINLTVRDGEFMVLVGPSGCGKSTTLRMIAGLEEISEGTISIDGQTVNHVPPKDRDIAMVFQNYALYPHLSVYDNLAFGLKLRKFAPAQIDARVREAATMLGISNLLDRRPKALSGGQRQRVAVGRAIVRKPKVFLFDEPLSNLDAKMRASTRVEISRLHSRLRATMIYVTHDQVEAMTMGDRICVMKDGKILQVDAPLDLYHRPRTLFVAGFIGSPPMNFFRGKIEAARARLSFVETAGDRRGISVPLDMRENSARVRAYADREVVLGVRPEDFRGAGPSGIESPGQCFEAPIEGVETMGAEIHLHLSTQSGTCIARVPPHTSLRAGGVFKFSFVPDKLHLFDAATEQVID